MTGSEIVVKPYTESLYKWHCVYLEAGLKRNTTRVGLGTSVRPWAGAVSVAAIGGCRRDVGVGEAASRCIRVSAIPIARPYGDTCTSLHTLISDGPA